MPEIDDLRRAVSEVPWYYWINSAGPQVMKLTLDRIGANFRIGEGASEMERCWNFQRTPVGVVLTIWGDHGGPTVHAEWNGEEFSGKWLDCRHCAMRLVASRPLQLDFGDLHDQATGSPEPFYVGIPTLCCYDLCRLAVDSVLQSTLLPERVYVVDNGSESTGFHHSHPLVSVLRVGRNLGVARSWNLLRSLSAPHPLVILNDDISIGVNCLEKLLRTASPVVTLDERRTYEAVLIRDQAWNLIGGFDETFYPAYHEDNDHATRLRLAGMKIACPLNHGVLQRGPSASKQRHTPEQHKEFCRQFDAGRDYYIRKWGGVPQQEVYLTPFNR